MTRIPDFQRHLYPPGWNAISKCIKAKDGWQCKGCGRPSGHPMYYLTTHHIDWNPQNVDDDNLICLFKLCHDIVSGMRPQPRTRGEIILRLKQQGRQIRIL